MVIIKRELLHLQCFRPAFALHECQVEAYRCDQALELLWIIFERRHLTLDILCFLKFATY